MVVLREPGEVFLLGHEVGPEAGCWVERIDPVTLAPQARSELLPGGPTWPGGLAAHADGSLHVVFGRHAHRLDPGDLRPQASRTLPRPAPHNSFVVLADGRLVTKDFGGLLPGRDPADHRPPAAELLALDPATLDIVDRCTLPEPSVARLSSDGSAVYVVGTTTLWRVRTEGGFRLDPDFAPRYRTLEGQGYGWDAVLALGAAWFLDNGEGTEAYDGSLRGKGRATAPLHLVRVDLADGSVALQGICGRPGGVVANPPLVDEARRIVVGFDTGHGVLAAFDIDLAGRTTPRWRRDQDHGSHLLLFGDTGELVTADHRPGAMAEDLVVLDVASGEERLRVPSGGPLQSVLFPAAGFSADVYTCSFSTVSRLSGAGPSHP
jgi:hypothetical protein